MWDAALGKWVCRFACWRYCCCASNGNVGEPKRYPTPACLTEREACVGPTATSTARLCRWLRGQAGASPGNRITIRSV